jgi:hypothetical protein
MADRVQSKIAAILAAVVGVGFALGAVYLLANGFWGEGLAFLLFLPLPLFGAYKAWRKYT